MNASIAMQARLLADIAILGFYYSILLKTGAVRGHCPSLNLFKIDSP